MVTADRASMRPDLPWDANEYAWQANRPPAHRAPPPTAGDRLLFRPANWSEQLQPIIVTAVQDLDSDEARRDPNVYDKVTSPDHREILYGPDGQPLTRLRADPWPWIEYRQLDEDGQPYGAPRTCREARMRGAAGWLPADHTRRERPHWDGATLVLPGGVG